MKLVNNPVTPEEWEKVRRDWRVSDELPWYQKFREMPMAIVEENEMPQWKTPEELFNAVKAMGTTFVRYPAIGWGAHFYGESASLPKYKGMKENEDFYGDVCKYFHEHGGYVCSYNHVSGVMYEPTLELHPDWLAKNDKGEYVKWNDMHYIGCLSSKSFVEAMLVGFEEQCAKYGTDAIYLDAPAWYSGFCQCDNCKKLWRETFGEEMPKKFNEASEEIRKFHRMREQFMFSVIKAIHEITQKYGIPLIINSRFHRNIASGSGNKELNLTIAEGTNSGEGYRPRSTFWSMMNLWRMGEAEKCLSYAYCPVGTYYNFRSYGSDEALAVGMGQVMLGMTPFLESATSYLYDTTGGEKLKEICNNIYEHAPMYYRVQPVRDLAVVSGDKELTTCTFARYEKIVKEYEGCLEALGVAGRHFDCIFDSQLGDERLKGYRAIYLPTSYYIDDFTAGVLRRYVENGGNIICGPDFSRYNDEGKPQSKFALADLLGVDFEHENDMSITGRHEREYRESAGVYGYAPIPESYVKIVKDLPNMPATTPVVPISDAVVRLNLDIDMYYVVAKPHADTEVLAELFLPAGGCRGEELEFPEGHPPAITRHKVGKGNVYWLAFRPGYNFIARGQYDVRKLLVAICDVAGDGPVVEYDTAGAMPCFLVENKEGDKFLHLTNYTGPMHERSVSIDKIVPLTDVKIRVKNKEKVSKVSTVYGKQELAFTRDGDYVEFTLPYIHVYETIKIEK